MTTKKQKRMAGEARQQELDAATEANIAFRTQRAKDRERKRQRRMMEAERREMNIAATKKIRGGGHVA